MAKLIALGLVAALFCALVVVIDHTHGRSRAAAAEVRTNPQQTSDRQMAKEIRREIVQDKKLSTYAHNVNVHVERGRVILRGLVPSETEAQSVRAKAIAAAGERNVSDKLEIAN